MTVGRRIALAFGLILVSGGVLSTVVYTNTQALISHNAWVVHTHAVIELLESVLRSTSRAEASTLSYVLSGDAAQLDHVSTARSRSDAALAKLELETRDNPKQHARLATLRSHCSALYAALERKSHAHDHAVDAELSAVRNLVVDMRDAEHGLLEQRVHTADTAAESTLLAIVWGGLAIVGLCAMVGLALTLSVVRPVTALVQGAAQLGAGNLQHRTSTGTSDELGTLADAFNNMAHNLGQTMVSADTERAARARIERLLETISETAAHLASSTAEIVAATNQQAAGAQEQVAAVTLTVSTITEVVQSSQHARQRAQHVAEIARDSADHGRTGRRVVQESLQAMQTVRGLVERATQRTTALADTARAIEQVIFSVSEIADQTKVLALNAALEATRAGAFGGTFAVVANSVKQLATQSKRAAEEVRRMLQDVQTASASLVVGSHECSQSVAAAADIIARADSSISALASVIEAASQSADQIAASAGQQETGTFQLHTAMKQIQAVTVQNLGATRQMEQAAKDLNALGGRLRADLTQVSA